MPRTTFGAPQAASALRHPSSRPAGTGSIVSRSTKPDVAHAGHDVNGSSEGFYGVGAGVSLAEGQGFWINSVKPGGPAETAGMQKGDVIVSIDGRRPTTLSSLRTMLLGPKGTKVEITIRRKTGLGVPTQTTLRVVRGGGSMAAAPVLGIGMGFRMTPSGSFVVSNVQGGGPAERAGVQSGDTMVSYNGEPLQGKSGSYLTEALSHNEDAIVRFGIRRSDVASTLSVVVVRTPLTLTNRVPSPSPAIASSPSISTADPTPSSVPSAHPGSSLAGSGPLGSIATPGGTYTQAHAKTVGSSGFPGSGYNSPYDSDKSDSYSVYSSNSRTNYLSDSSQGYSSDDSPSPYVHGLAARGGKAAAPWETEGGGASRHSKAVRSSEELLARAGTQHARQRREEGGGLAMTAPAKTGHREGERGESGGGQGAGGEDWQSQVRALTTIVNQQARELAELKARLDGEGEKQRVEREREREAELARVKEEWQGLKEEIRKMREEEEKRLEAQELLTKTLLQIQRAERERAERETARAEGERRRELAVDALQADMKKVREEQDGMMDGVEEIKGNVKSMLQRVDESLKQEADSVQTQLNAVRAQVATAINDIAGAALLQPASMSAHSSRPPSRPASDSLQPLLAAGVVAETLSGDLSLQESVDGGEDGGRAEEGGKGEGVSAAHHHHAPPFKAHSPKPSSKEPDEAMPNTGQLKGPPSPLVPRLRVKRCVTDDAVPASLRCAAVVVAKRLFLFPKGRDAMCDLQFAMVMDLVSLRLWALRVMGSLPLRCRCMFVVVKESICVLPCDSAGRSDLRQIFVLTSADEDRVYSQGCYVEMEAPQPCFCRCEVTGSLCFIFPHDGEGNYDLTRVCVLDTDLLTLRVCGGAFMPTDASDAAPHGGTKLEIVVVGSKIVCVPLLADLRWRLEGGFVVDTEKELQRRPLVVRGSKPAPECAFTLKVMDARVLLFGVDDHLRLDLGSLFYVDPEQAEVNEKLVVVIPEELETFSLDFTAARVLDLSDPRAITVTAFPVELPMARSEVRLFVQGELLLVLPGARQACTQVSVLRPKERTAQVYAVDNFTKSLHGFEVESSGSELILIPFDSSGRRCVGEVALLDCNLVH